MEFDTESALQGFSQEELEWMVAFLETATGEFHEHGCNDFTMPANDTNKAIFTAVLAHHHTVHEDSDNALSESDIRDATGDVFIYDDWIAEYFTDRCRALLTRRPDAAPLTLAELDALALVLAHAYEDHEQYSGDTCYDVTVKLTADGRALVRAVLALYQAEHVDYPDAYRNSVAAQLAALDAQLVQGQSVKIPDFWIMYYLALKCRRLSGNPAPLYNKPDDAPAEWGDHTPTAVELQADALCVELRDLACKTYADAKVMFNLAADTWLSVCIITKTTAQRDALYRDQAFREALVPMREKFNANGMDLQCYAFLSQEIIDKGGVASWAGWWFKEKCPQIRYDDGPMTDRERAVRLGVSSEILDLASPAVPAVPAAPTAQRGASGGPVAMMKKHWLVVAFFAFFVAVLLFGKH